MDTEQLLEIFKKRENWNLSEVGAELNIEKVMDDMVEWILKEN